MEVRLHALGRVGGEQELGHGVPLEFLHLPGRGGDVRPMRVAINVESRDEVTLFVGGCAPEGPGDHSPRLQPWVRGHHFREALKGATQLLRETSDNAIRPPAPPAPIRGGQELVVSPFQGSSCCGAFPTAEAVGYECLAPPGPSEAEPRPFVREVAVGKSRGTACSARLCPA